MAERRWNSASSESDAPAPAPRLAPLWCGVLIGGQSQRMGTPKHLVEYRGATLLERVVRVAGPFVQRIVLLGRAAMLPGTLNALQQLEDVGSAIAGPGAQQRAVHGPLRGMLAAARHRSSVAWLILACDLPKLSAEVLEWLVSQRSAAHIAVLPRTPTGVEPLLAIYEPDGMAALSALVGAGARAPRALVDDPRVAMPSLPAELLAACANANTPEDLR